MCHFLDVFISHLGQVFLVACGVVQSLEEAFDFCRLGFFLQHVSELLANAFGSPAQMHFEHLTHVHA